MPIVYWCRRRERKERSLIFLQGIHERVCVIEERQIEMLELLNSLKEHLDERPHNEDESDDSPED